MMNIPDPIELMDSRIERQIALIDKDNTYPCCACGVRHDVDSMVAASAAPDAPLMCWDCFDPDGKVDKLMSDTPRNRQER